MWREMPKVLIPMKVVSDSDLIPVTCSEVKAVVFGAKRRWRSYGALSDRDGSTGIGFSLHFYWFPYFRIKPAAGAVEMWIAT
jgi:hypothetical protein